MDGVDQRFELEELRELAPELQPLVLHMPRIANVGRTVEVIDPDASTPTHAGVPVLTSATLGARAKSGRWVWRVRPERAEALVLDGWRKVLVPVRGDEGVELSDGVMRLVQTETGYGHAVLVVG